jgi:hypothetical protein
MFYIPRHDNQYNKNILYQQQSCKVFLQIAFQ